MSGLPEAGGAYELQPDGALKRVARTIGPNEAPEAEAPEAEAKKKPKSAPAAETPHTAEES